jgi:hypothetical protein
MCHHGQHDKDGEEVVNEVESGHCERKNESVTLKGVSKSIQMIRACRNQKAKANAKEPAALDG